mmetsp:Transcript_15499/g.50611  ORF Transcript_15499/g.50611 Transcript_15499/m.50611 type:complete len:234 (+) Transcript_15499:159-860(+)|eukprot:scaffold3913_cov101-Isochrysis_galbana.AAC.4
MHAANVIQPSTHRVWRMTTADELLAYLAECFPQIEDIESLVTRQEASGRGIACLGVSARSGRRDDAGCTRPMPVEQHSGTNRPPSFTPLQANNFISTPPGRFPAPQYVRQLSGLVGGTAFALFGDAAHAFPPDLGQGVNSALEDVSALLGAMRGQGIALRTRAPQRRAGQWGGGEAQDADTTPAGAGIDGAALARALEAAHDKLHINRVEQFFLCAAYGLMAYGFGNRGMRSL